MNDKRKAPNSIYWGYVLSHDVLVEPLGNGMFRAWSNNTKFLKESNWTYSNNHLGWGYMDFMKNEIKLFNWD